MKKIGQTFAKELAAAGLDALPLAWGDDGEINFGDDVTEIQRAEILAVYDAHDPGADSFGDKRKEISAACEAAILAGFESAALGDVHQYPSDRDDQLNLSGTIQRSQLPLAQPTDLYPFKCSLDGGAMVFRPHTAAQIQQVGADAYNAIVNARVKNAQRQAQIDAAESASDQKALDAVVW